MGEDLDSLSVKELQNLEQQIDTALKHVRSRKVRMFEFLVFMFFFLMNNIYWNFCFRTNSCMIPSLLFRERQISPTFFIFFKIIFDFVLINLLRILIYFYQERAIQEQNALLAKQVIVTFSLKRYFFMLNMI